MKTIAIKAAACTALTLVAGCGARPAPASAPAAATVTSCGRPVSVAAPPERAVTLEQNATEIMLSLGLGDRMAGTSYQTDPVLPALASAYAKIPVLAKLYPSREAVLDARPDFLYSTFTSAYATEAAGPRADLAELGVPAYLSRFACEKDPAPFSFEGLQTEITEIAGLFGVPGRGAALVADQRARLDAITRPAPGTTTLWYYSGTRTPYVAGAGGVPAAVSARLGVTNVFADAAQTWPAANWEQIATRDPDVIVLADLTRGGDGDSARSKLDFLRADPVTANLTAVKAGRFITVPGSAMDPSVRSVSAAEAIGAGLR